MIGLPQLYIAGGLFFAACAWLSARDVSNPQRLRAGAFWALLATSFLSGDKLGDLGNGLLVLVLGLVALASMGLGASHAPTSTAAERRESATRHGSALFLIALIIPVTALAGTLLAKQAHWAAALIDGKQATLVSLVLGVLLALAVAAVVLRPVAHLAGTTTPRPVGAFERSVVMPLREGRRLLDAVGWAAILPQMLASLGAVFLAAGVGAQVGKLFSAHLPLDSRFTAVATYCVGMALFTALMGNAFAAFPVMTAAVGLPVIVHRFGGDPAVVCAIGMLSGFCGTLLTPMAANFNVVPANLLDLPDRNAPFNGVIRAQAPTALPLLAVNIALMLLLAWR